MAISSSPGALTIRDGIRPLWTPGGIHELRVLNTERAGTVSGYFDSPEGFAEAASRWSGRAPGVYVTINPVRPEVHARAFNKAKERARSTTSDSEIACRRWLPLDFDVIRPKDISSTDAEHQHALDRAVEAAKWLVSLGISRDSLVLADSGNGGHLLARIDLPNDTAALELVRRCTEAVSLRFTDNTVRVDLTMVNAARIWKVYGTLVRKGDDVPDRPHRVARLIQAPSDPVVIAPEVLARLALLAPAAPERTSSRQGERFDIAGFIDRHLAGDVHHDASWNGGRKWVLRECPFNPDHNDRSAVIIEHASGALSFTCHHDSCGTKRWTDLRELLEPRYAPGTVAVSRTPVPPANGHAPPPEEMPRRRWPLTDTGNAERLMHLHGDDLLYCAVRGSWYAWDGTRFAVDDTQEIMRRAKDTARWMFYEETKGVEDLKERADLASHALKSENTGKLKAMVENAQSDDRVAIRLSDLDADPWLFNCLNGTIDLRTGDLRAHDRADRITKCSPVAFDPDADCPQWKSALRLWMNGDEEMIAFLQRALGLSLTGLTSDNCFFFAHGPGRNGKSVCIRTAEYVLGDYAQPTRAETIMARPRGDTSNDLAALVGIRFVPTIEVDEGSKLAEGLVKQLTGGDRVSVRFLYGEYFAFTPKFKLWLVANSKPIIKGTDAAIWTRVRLIPFEVTIPKEQQDPELTERLKDEGPGILQWMCEGCLDWQRGGLRPPAKVLLATEEYREEMDTFSQFLEDRCLIVPDGMVFASTLYVAYTEWCSANGERPWSKKRFGSVLADRGFKRDRAPTSDRARMWIGIEVADEPAQSSLSEGLT